MFRCEMNENFFFFSEEARVICWVYIDRMNRSVVNDMIDAGGVSRNFRITSSRVVLQCTRHFALCIEKRQCKSKPRLSIQRIDTLHVTYATPPVQKKPNHPIDRRLIILLSSLWKAAVLKTPLWRIRRRLSSRVNQRAASGGRLYALITPARLSVCGWLPFEGERDFFALRIVYACAAVIGYCEGWTLLDKWRLKVFSRSLVGGTFDFYVSF